MPNSEISKTFDEKRHAFKPYDLTFEKWAPQCMPHPDRHNEIELNYFPEGTMTYLLRGEEVTVPAKKLVLPDIDPIALAIIKGCCLSIDEKVCEEGVEIVLHIAE